MSTRHTRICIAKVEFEGLCELQSRPTPERRLLGAMIARAIRDVLDEAEYRREARRYLNSNSRKPFAFLWALEHLVDDVRGTAAAIRAAADACQVASKNDLLALGTPRGSYDKSRAKKH